MAALIRLGREWYPKGGPALFSVVDIAEYGKKNPGPCEGVMTLIYCHHVSSSPQFDRNMILRENTRIYNYVA